MEKVVNVTRLMGSKCFERFRFGFADHCARLEIIFTYL